MMPVDSARTMAQDEKKRYKSRSPAFIVCIFALVVALSLLISAYMGESHSGQLNRPSVTQLWLGNSPQLSMQDSLDATFRDVEELGGWESYLGVECKK